MVGNKNSGRKKTYKPKKRTYTYTKRGPTGPRSCPVRTYDERDIELRRKVMVRDRYVCQFPGCSKKKRLQVHHIVRWVDAPSLRYNVQNCICLCYTCHKRVTGYENLYNSMFKEIIRRNSETF